MSGRPSPTDAERLLAGIRFRPRASLGPEIAGRVRRGEVATGGLGPRRSPLLRRVLVGAAVTLVASAALHAGRSLAVLERHADHCCRNLDGGSDANDGYVLRSRGRQVEELTLYEDLDGDRRLSAGDRVRLARGARPVFGADSVQSTVRICCEDLDGEGAADDGLVVMNGAGERILLAGIFEQRGQHQAGELR